MVTTRKSTPLEYLVFGLKPEAPDTIRNPYYVAVQAGKPGSTLEFVTNEADSATDERIALQRLAEAVARDVYDRSSASYQREPLRVLDIVFSFSPPYATRIRGECRDATFPLNEESRKLFSSSVLNVYRRIAQQQEFAPFRLLERLDGGR